MTFSFSVFGPGTGHPRGGKHLNIIMFEFSGVRKGWKQCIREKLSASLVSEGRERERELLKDSLCSRSLPDAGLL